jgi:hypothetical protein
MDAITEKQKSLIVNNIVKACDDITKLNGTGYKFIHLANGFIAHYNIDGFKQYYSTYDLMTHIIGNAPSNEWNNFREGDQNYHYYKSRKDVYSRIVAKLRNKTVNLWNT